MIEQARRLTFDDVEYHTHCHPYRDEDEMFQQAQFGWLQQILRIRKQQQHFGNDKDVTRIVETLEHNIQRYDRRIATLYGC
jgi:hypothetical protein